MSSVDDVLANLSKVRARRKAALTRGKTLQSMLLDVEDVVEEGGEKKDEDILATGGRRRGGVLPPPDLSNLALPPGLAAGLLAGSDEGEDTEDRQNENEEETDRKDEKDGNGEEEEEEEEIEDDGPPSSLATDLAAFQDHLRMLATQANPDMQFGDVDEDDEEEELQFDTEDTEDVHGILTSDGSTQTLKHKR